MTGRRWPLGTGTALTALMFEGLFQPMHMLVILVIAMLVFGPKSSVTALAGLTAS
jgi:mttA/Hcf106 family